METTRTLMMLLLHTDSSINHIHNHNHNHSRQSSFDQSIARATARLSPTSNSNQPRTRSSGSLIESMPTKRQRDTKRARMHQRESERVAHLDLESIEQSLACRRGALVYCCQPDDRQIIERERERELELQMEDAISLSRSRSRAHNHAHRGATCLRNGRSGL